jgi:ParB family chromosome partitioning protein
MTTDAAESVTLGGIESPGIAPVAARIAKPKGGNMLIDPATTSNEHYTPAWLAQAAREVMGWIDLDPASCAAANAVVRANVYHGFDRGTDGLQRAQATGWVGKVFLNPPGGYLPNVKPRQSAVPIWWRTLVQQWQRLDTEEAIFLAFNMNVFRTSQAFADVMPPHLFPFCVPKERICFDRLDANGNRAPGMQPPQDSAIIYLPPAGHTARDVAVSRFARIFGQFGAVRV